MSNSEVTEYIYDTTDTSEVNVSPEDMLKGYTLEGKWDQVVELYKSDPKFSTIEINKSRGTALHVAVNDGNDKVVKNLVNSILSHNNVEALKCRNEKGDTPLHLAASRGFKDICECIIGKDGERKYLIDIDNENGETPLFLAVLSWQKQTFVYLLDFKPSGSDYGGNYSYTKYLIRSNGDNILHCAIQRDFFDLALMIIHKYPDLIVIPTKDGFSPLKLLATRPSAFYSGCKMIWWKRILYHCIPVETLIVEDACPKNYNTCYLFLHKCREYAKRLLRKEPNPGSNNMGEERIDLQPPMISMTSEVLPENYTTWLWFLKCLMSLAYLAYYYILVLSGVGVEEIKKMKQKHKWSGQLLNIFMENPYESYLGTGAKPARDLIVTNYTFNYNSNLGDDDNDEEPEISAKLEREKAILESDTAIFTAARNGIVEIVEKILTKIPSSIYEVDLENKNVLVVAVENKRIIAVEALRKWFIKCNTKEIFNRLIQEVDKEENTVLHLAATSDQGVNIPGAALQMMWNSKCFQYTEGLVPEHFKSRTNKKGKTAEELFKKSHAELVKEGSTWLKETSESCSVVAALLAGVSFAASSTVPGGNRSETGEPTLEGKPAFDAFALSSLIGLCFSLTALIMFLSILTSRKEARDFRNDLPRKLLVGLSSLFLSIIAMFTAFCSGNFFLIEHRYKHMVFLIYATTSFPVTLYAMAQLPLYIDLLEVL